MLLFRDNFIQWGLLCLADCHLCPCFPVLACHLALEDLAPHTILMKPAWTCDLPVALTSARLCCLEYNKKMEVKSFMVLVLRESFRLSRI
jgi:hypothetical protein